MGNQQLDDELFSNTCGNIYKTYQTWQILTTCYVIKQVSTDNKELVRSRALLIDYRVIKLKTGNKNLIYLQVFKMHFKLKGQMRN